MQDEIENRHPEQSEGSYFQNFQYSVISMILGIGESQNLK